MNTRLEIRIRQEQRDQLAAVAREFGLSTAAAARLAIAKLVAEQRQQPGARAA
jgi:hypothetical protein